MRLVVTAKRLYDDGTEGAGTERIFAADAHAAVGRWLSAYIGEWIGKPAESGARCHAVDARIVLQPDPEYDEADRWMDLMGELDRHLTSREVR